MKIKKIMKKLLLLACVVLCLACKNTEQPQSMKMINQIDFSHVQINDAFWSPRLEKHKTATLPVCIDQIENQTGRIRNFENAAKHKYNKTRYAYPVITCIILFKVYYCNNENSDNTQTND